MHAFLVMRSLHEEIRPEEAIELESLYSRFNEEWKVMEKQEKKKKKERKYSKSVNWVLQFGRNNMAYKFRALSLSL